MHAPCGSIHALAIDAAVGVVRRAAIRSVADARNLEMPQTAPRFLGPSLKHHTHHHKLMSIEQRWYMWLAHSILSVSANVIFM
jgi:hypothetical protein